MKLPSILYAALLIPLAVTAQTGALKISYNYHFFTVRGHEVERPMILITDMEKSKFYNPTTDWIDSLNTTPEGRAKYRAMRPRSYTGKELGSIPTRWEKMYVTKNRTDSLITEYDTLGDERLYYSDKLQPIEWNMTDSTKTILGYECAGAEAYYHGRHWHVFFTPEVPLPEGPWKLCGLPGIILEAKDSTGQYSFTADGLEEYPTAVPPIYEQELYERTTRKELLKDKRFFNENLGAIVTSMTDAKELHQSQLKSLQLKTDLDFLETDYR